MKKEKEKEADVRKEEHSQREGKIRRRTLLKAMTGLPVLGGFRI